MSTAGSYYLSSSTCILVDLAIYRSCYQQISSRQYSCTTRYPDIVVEIQLVGPYMQYYIDGKHPIYLIYDSGHTNIPQVLEIWPNIPIYLMQAGQQSKYQYTSPTHVITIRYVIDMEYTRCDRIGRFQSHYTVPVHVQLYTQRIPTSIGTGNSVTPKFQSHQYV